MRSGKEGKTIINHTDMEDDIKIIKSRKFAYRIIKLYQYLNSKNIEDIRRQVLRSGTSIGANIAESVFSESKIDFKHKISIALKEANETLYWIDILFYGEYISKNLYESIKNDCVELILILSSIIKTIKDGND